VGVDRNGLGAKSGIENDISGFPSNPGQRLESRPGARNPTVVFVFNLLTGFENMSRLTVEKADVPYMPLQVVKAKIKHSLRRGRDTKKRARRFVN
jgi:hypothetical protein